MLKFILGIMIASPSAFAQVSAMSFEQSYSFQKIVQISGNAMTGVFEGPNSRIELYCGNPRETSITLYTVDGSGHWTNSLPTFIADKDCAELNQALKSASPSHPVQVTAVGSVQPVIRVIKH